MVRDIPPKLYKYQPFTTWSLSNLKDRSVWFSKPNKFNDPFDCAFGSEVVSIPDSEWVNLYEKYKRGISSTPEFDTVYLTNGLPNEKFQAEALTSIQNSFEKRRIQMLNDRGVACFAEEVDNLLMWSHYADGHRGFCLEFRTDFEPFRDTQKIFPVIYSEDLPLVNPVPLLNNDWEPMMSMIYTKSNGWAYEKEWRIFHLQGDHAYTLEPSVLSGVYFGCSMPYVHKELISLVLRDSPTQLYEMNKEAGRFDIFSKRVEYIPFDYSSKGGA